MNDIVKLMVDTHKGIVPTQYANTTKMEREDAIRKAIYMGGDTDTNACIVGAMAEAAYGINDKLIENVNEKIPSEFKKILSKTLI